MNYQIRLSSPNPVFASFDLGNKVLDRNEAKALMQQLVPGTEAYNQLQHILIRTNGIREIILDTEVVKVNASPQGILGGFGSAEHVAIGTEITLQGIPENPTLLPKGSAQVKFSHIVALAGDFYGIAGEAISLPGGNDDDKTARFQKAFNTLRDANNEQVRRLVLEIDNECNAVRFAALPHHCYSSQMLSKNEILKRIKGDIEELLIDNSDHFSLNAQEAYRIGHTLAIKEAQISGRNNDLEGLQYAYAIDAFACHFLTDLFASGHIRNQRGPLEIFLLNIGFPKGMAKPLAGLLTGAQHESDGNEGLNVKNQKGEYWRAYGDGCFWTPKNSENKEKVVTATQKSVDEVYHAYQNPDVPPLALVYTLIPEATEFNPPPLYSVDKECGVLTIYNGSQVDLIKTKTDFLNKGLSQALRYLPQDYLNGFIDKFVKPFDYDFPLINKILAPQVERLTGVVWQSVGLASCHEIRKASEQMTKKLIEMAASVKALHDASAKIFDQLQNVNQKIDNISYQICFQELLEPMATINARISTYQDYYSTFNKDELMTIADLLFDSYTAMASVLKTGFMTNGTHVLSSYKARLAEEHQADEREITIRATLWFRQLLDFQIQAFELHASICTTIDKNYPIQDRIKIFQNTLSLQVEAHRNFIDQELVYNSCDYVFLQLKKHQMKKLYIELFK